ncbi:MAG: response regulator [Polyangiaceae bacterium]
MSALSYRQLSKPAISPALRTLNILLAEDHEEMRNFLHAELRADGHHVATTRDGREMLAALTAISELPISKPDAIIMDVRMPECSGMQILAALRAAQWTTPVILITAFGDDALHREATRLGAAAVFDKPFDVDDLKTALWNLEHLP